MTFHEAFEDLQSLLTRLSPEHLKALARARLDEVVLAEVGRARGRVVEVEKRYPSASQREQAQRLIDAKKSLASAIGGVTGAFGLIGIPGDLLVMSWLQIALVVDVATLYKVNLKGTRARNEVLDVVGYANGVGPLARTGPRLLGTLAGKLLEKGGLKTFGKALPVAAAPISAYLNQRHIQQVGEQVIRFYAGLEKAKAKSSRARKSGGTTQRTDSRAGGPTSSR